MIKRILIFAIFWNISYNADIPERNQNFLKDLTNNQRISLIHYSSFLNFKKNISVAGISICKNFDCALTAQLGIGIYGILTLTENVFNIGAEYKAAKQIYINNIPEEKRNIANLLLYQGEKSASIDYLVEPLTNKI